MGFVPLLTMVSRRVTKVLAAATSELAGINVDRLLKSVQQMENSRSSQQISVGRTRRQMK